MKQDMFLWVDDILMVIFLLLGGLDMIIYIVTGNLIILFIGALIIGVGIEKLAMRGVLRSYENVNNRFQWGIDRQRKIIKDLEQLILVKFNDKPKKKRKRK